MHEPCAFAHFLLAGRLFEREFCTAVAKFWRETLEDVTLTASETDTFDALLAAVDWYSEYPEDRASHPGFLSEAQLRKAARTFLRKITAELL